jgi:hypothetical protein
MFRKYPLKALADVIRGYQPWLESLEYGRLIEAWIHLVDAVYCEL